MIRGTENKNTVDYILYIKYLVLIVHSWRQTVEFSLNVSFKRRTESYLYEYHYG